MAAKKAKKKSGSSSASLAITGASGSIGASVLRALAAGKKPGRTILALDIKPPSVASKAVRYVKLDLTQPTADAALAEAFREHSCDTVVHTAFFSRPIKDESYAHELEALGTMHLLNACARAEIKKIIIAGTTAVYGASPKNPNFLKEDDSLQGNKTYRYIRDRIEVETLADRYRQSHPDTVVTVLRLATILGSTVRNMATDYFRRPVVPTLMGYDPLVQFLHEEDAVRAFVTAIEGDFSGAYNIVGKGVLPLNTVISLMGKISLPLLSTFAYPAASAFWLMSVADAPGQHLDYIRYLWIADGEKAKREMGFEPRYSTREVILAFTGAKRLREIKITADSETL